MYFSFSHHHVRHFRPREFDKNDPTYKLSSHNYIYDDQLTDLGFPSSTKSDLIYCMTKFGIDKTGILPYFVAICAYASKNGSIVIEGKSEGKYRGSGYLMLKGEDQYSNFAQMINDDKIIEEGAEYVANKYPWTSAAYVWKQNYMNDFVKLKDFQRVSVTKACKELLGSICDRNTINQLYSLTISIFSIQSERGDNYYENYYSNGRQQTRYRYY